MTTMQPAADSAPNVWLLSHITQCPSIDHVFTFWQKLPTCLCRFFCQDTKPSKIGSYFRDMIRYMMLFQRELKTCTRKQKLKSGNQKNEKNGHAQMYQ